MALKKATFPLFILFILPIFIFACSTPSWFPIKKGPPHKAKMKELVDKEIVIIDKLEYVKVLNPNRQGPNQPKYLYIPVDDYLANKESYLLPSAQKEEGQITLSSTLPPALKLEKLDVPQPTPVPSILPLKKKILIAYFEDRTSSDEEVFGDWMAEKLVKEVSQKAPNLIFIDYPMVKDFFEKRGLSERELESQKGLRLLNEAFGVHAVVTGQLCGPYMFTSKGPKDQEEIASSIIQIEAKIFETSMGKMIKTLSVQNPLIATKVKGTFAEEKAKSKAIEMALMDLARVLSKELDRVEWFGRIAKVEGGEVYINAGKLSGLKIGDVMEVLPIGSHEERKEVKARIQISAFLGIDASVARWIQGQKPEIMDIIKLAYTEGS